MVALDQRADRFPDGSGPMRVLARRQSVLPGHRSLRSVTREARRQQLEGPLRDLSAPSGLLQGGCSGDTDRTGNGCGHHARFRIAWTSTDVAGDRPSQLVLLLVPPFAEPARNRWMVKQLR